MSTDDAGPNEDVGHAIPKLDALDTLFELERGAYVGIVIAAPLRDDVKSRARLERKLQFCFSFFGSEEFAKRWGAPDPNHCRLYIDLHASSDPSMVDLAFGQSERILDLGVQPVIKLIGTN